MGTLATGFVVGNVISPISSVENGYCLGYLIGGEQALEEGVALFVELSKVRFHFALLPDLFLVVSAGCVLSPQLLLKQLLH